MNKKAKKLDIHPSVVVARCAITFPKPPPKPTNTHAIKPPFSVYVPEGTMAGVTCASKTLGVPVASLIMALERTGRYAMNRNGHENSYSLHLWEYVCGLAGVQVTVRTRYGGLRTPLIADVRAIYDACGRRPQKQEAA